MTVLSMQHRSITPGCVHSLPTGSVYLELRLEALSPGLCARLGQCLDAAFWTQRAAADAGVPACWSGPAGLEGMPVPEPLLALSLLLHRAHQQAECVLPAAPVWFALSGSADRVGAASARGFVPSLSPATVARWLPGAIALLNRLAAGDTEAPADALQALVDGLRDSAPPGYNNLRLLRAAFAMGIPVLPLAQGVYQYGWGARARWLQSTLTDATPGLSVQHARDKAVTNRLLALAQLPVPRHFLAGSADQAVAMAEKLGYPVVVKPADCDAGRGVRANLHSPDSVREAWAHARRASRRILVEEHVPGREYRFTVVHGHLLWAHERVPAHVTGDGNSSLAELVARENGARSQGLAGPQQLLLQLVDADLVYLRERGYSMQTVPAVGEPVRLQAIPRAMGGGDGESVMAVIHPDNIRLAERAVQQLRLDVAKPRARWALPHLPGCGWVPSACAAAASPHSRTCAACSCAGRSSAWWW